MCRSPVTAALAVVTVYTPVASWTLLNTLYRRFHLVLLGLKIGRYYTCHRKRKGNRDWPTKLLRECLLLQGFDLKIWLALKQVPLTCTLYYFIHINYIKRIFSEKWLWAKYKLPTPFSLLITQYLVKIKQNLSEVWLTMVTARQCALVKTHRTAYHKEQNVVYINYEWMKDQLTF